MRLSALFAAYATTLLAVNGLNILISNDDGFGTANIRELYKAVKAKGHTVYLVASVSNQSGIGGTATYTKERNLTADSEFDIVKAGDPSVGTDPNDSHIWYFNGTPSSCVQVALDYVLPRYTNLTTFDLMLSGPNYGLNVNIPFISSFINDSCVDHPFIQTRLTGSADVDRAAYIETTGLFTYANIVTDGVNQCINGDCSLPGETAILNVGCQSAVSVFTVDYDAPIGGTCTVGPDVRGLLLPLVQYQNSTGTLFGGLNRTSTTGSNGTVTSPTPSSTLLPVSSGAMKGGFQSGVIALCLVLGAIFVM